MATKSTLLNYTKNENTYIPDERYVNVGSNFYLGNVKRAFLETDFSIEYGDSDGAQLVENVDFEFTVKDSYYTSEEGVDVWTEINILNPAYETGVLYITYRAIGSYVDQAFLQTLRDDVDTNTIDITTIQAQLGNSTTITSNYTILDDDGFDKFYINPSSGIITITLPTLSANQDRKLKFIVTDLGGKVTIDGEGAETIGGYSSLYLHSKNDNLEIIAEAGEWQIIKYYAKYDTGWQNRSDWTNVHLGTSTFLFDNRSGAFTIGELITEATSGNTGIIQSMTDATTGTIKVKNVTGTGIWTNNRQVTGATSGETCDVNEVSGSNKNQDTNIFHEFGINISNLLIQHYISTDGTNNNSFYTRNTSATGNYGEHTNQVDTNNAKFHAGANGIIYMNDSGALDIIDAEDWYYKIIVEAKI